MAKTGASKVIKGGTVITADRTFRADILIEDGKIAAIGDSLEGDEVIDASGCYVMPGGIDPHTHLQMPFMGTYSSDDFDTGTAAALAGGTTMVVDFVLPDSEGNLLDALQEWFQKAGKARTDYSFHMAITGWNERTFNEMAEVVKRGINTFKHFMAYKGALMVNDDEMFASFQRCAELGAMPLVHAENGDIVAQLQAKLMAEGNDGPEAHAYSRPPEVEGEATNRAIMIADQAGVPLYVVHVSCEQSHEAIRRARQKGMRVFGEPLIQHLTLDESEYHNRDWDYAARRVMSPPFRDKLNQDSLWAGLAAGSLQCVATDHCAFTTEQKRYGIGNFTKIPNGTGGLEERMPVLWTRGVRTGRLTPNEFVAVTSTNIAKILNIYPQKGAVVPGADADLVIWDPEATKKISAKTQHSSIDYNVFEGFELKGLPIMTLSRGRIAFDKGQVTAKPGDGRFIEREPNGAVNRALSQWKEIVAPRKVERSAEHMPIGV
ncbi:dihydropyrimidinase [Brucella suis 63/252]|uniref:D-hydantoinase/dihydropyrimidinase n=6 Tax=Brucella TaxID=234 RepID=A9M7W3_BRUC2|nr:MULTISPECIES: dihydropyrimidinase [Brucella]KEY02260.1 dihydropyrimidinase [Brucella inopinata BO1]CUW43110.1 dihydroorotase [Brucella vulpis]ABQ60222.1 dihydropyrimidinase [Brucella ovis ATCC 25840]ABX61373.1 dihydropyrimidinase [Brucella canis ATCC 23365]ABY37396.1 dihydropyrimidinase [Brucella suis ATCC 23445]